MTMSFWKWRGRNNNLQIKWQLACDLDIEEIYVYFFEIIEIEVLAIGNLGDGIWKCSVSRKDI